MIKIAILTPQNSYNAIKEALEDVHCIKEYIFYENLYELGDIYKKIAHKYHGIITSGPIGYENIKTHVNITTPIYYLEISKSDLFKYLFEISREYKNIDFSRVYIDFISNNNRNYWLENIFSIEEEPIFFPLDYSDIKLYDILKKNYLELKKEKKLDYVLTRISNMLPFLEKNKIPYKFLFPSKNTIKKKVIQIINDIKLKKIEKNQIIFGILESSGNLEDIQNTIQNNFKNCILQINKTHIDILILKEDFIESNVNEVIREKIKDKFFIAWGIGENFNEARYYAEKALDKSKNTSNKIVYIASSQKISPLTKITKNEKEKIEIVKKLKELNFTNEKIKILLEIYKKNEEIDSKNLAKYLLVSERTSIRILERLKKYNLASSSLIKLKRGRPKKVYSLNF